MILARPQLPLFYTCHGQRVRGGCWLLIRPHLLHRGEWVCTLCRSLVQPEMEYDCENARYSQPGVRPAPGLSVYDQKVGKRSGKRVSCVRQTLCLQRLRFFQGDDKPVLGGDLC